MALLILALLQRIFLMSSLMLLLVWLIFFRSEERFSRNAETDLVCRLLLEKKKKLVGSDLPRFKFLEPHHDSCAYGVVSITPDASSMATIRVAQHKCH